MNLKGGNKCKSSRKYYVIKIRLAQKGVQSTTAVRLIVNGGLAAQNLNKHALGCSPHYVCYGKLR
jgi:hypothetical protein